MINGKAVLNLATWNIHRGTGADGERDLGRTGRVIIGLNPDVIGLQEVENRIGPDRDDLARLGEVTGMEVYAGPTLKNQTGNYGNALLTRLPVLDIERYDISYRDREPRGVLLAAVDWEGERLRVAVTHLGLMPGERRYQVRRLVEFLSGKNSPLILMGDFNEWLIWGRPLRWLHRHFGPLRGPATFPSRWPVLRLDHILAEPRKRLTGKKTFRSSLAVAASDHLPLTAGFQKT